MVLVKEEFDKRGWLTTFQPPNTPLSNELDAAVFPAVAKKGSAISGLLHQGRHLECEKLWKVIERAWDEYPCNSIAREFVHHDQVLAAFEKEKGGDEWLKGRAALNFGVRRVCRPYFGQRD